MLGKAKEELDKVDTCMNHTRDLRERFEDDFEKSRNEKFDIPKEEGKWDSYTTNRPSTDTRKLTNILASSRLKLWIPLTDEDEKKRKNLSKTERFPYGAIALRDSIYQTIPSALCLQESMSWFAPVRGWVALLCYLYEEDDGKNGKVTPHIPVWDILNTYWIEGSSGLLWAAYKRYATADEVKDQYGEDLKPDSKGRVELYNVWDGDQFGTIGEKEWVGKKGQPTDHNCGHLPVLILPAGATPLIQSGRHSNTIKDVGESCLVNNRNLYDTESRMGSYLLTLAGRAAKTPLKHKWDSTKGGTAPELDSSPFEKGTVVPVDVGMGEDVEPTVPPQLTREFFAFFEYLQSRLSVGGQTPIAFGEINQALPAAGINLLRHASLDNIKPFQQVMERAYAWLGHELVSQYKSGSWSGGGKMKIQGIDGSNRLFKVDVKPDDIDDSWNFNAKLIADLPQDMMANIGMAVQATQADLLSLQTSRDRFDLSDDPDQEQGIIDRERAFRIAAIQLRKTAAALMEDGDEEGAQIIIDEIERMRGETEQRRPGVASQPGMPSPVRPSADTTAVVPEPPGVSKFKKFMSRFGGG